MMEQLTDHHYEVLTVPEESAANCVYIKALSNRDFLLHRPAEECPDSLAVSAPLFFFFYSLPQLERFFMKLKDYGRVILSHYALWKFNITAP